MFARVQRAVLQSAVTRTFVRRLNIHEHDAKRLLAKDDIKVQRFDVAANAEDAYKAAQKLGTSIGGSPGCADGGSSDETSEWMSKWMSE